LRRQDWHFTFHSTSYEWLVVAGAQAQYKGAGTLNGEPGYQFFLTAVDGQLNGSGTDRFCVKIWKDGQTVPVYDNQRGAADKATATTAIGGGSIMVHYERSKARWTCSRTPGTPDLARAAHGVKMIFSDWRKFKMDENPTEG
jgi:hypothetical protein